MPDKTRQSSEIPAVILSWVVVIAALLLLASPFYPIFFILIGTTVGVYAVMHYRGKGERGLVLAIRFFCCGLIAVGLLIGGFPLIAPLFMQHPEKAEGIGELIAIIGGVTMALYEWFHRSR